MARREKNTAESILARLIANHPDECWIWPGGTFHGYGVSSLDGKSLRVHRIAWEYFQGPIPAGLQIDHLCRNRACSNPIHLEPVTQTVNMQRGEAGLHEKRKTHCPAGHPYDEANTWHWRNERHCRACRRANTRRLETLYPERYRKATREYKERRRKALAQ